MKFKDHSTCYSIFQTSKNSHLTFVKDNKVYSRLSVKQKIDLTRCLLSAVFKAFMSMPTTNLCSSTKTPQNQILDLCLLSVLMSVSGGRLFTPCSVWRKFLNSNAMCNANSFERLKKNPQYASYNMIYLYSVTKESQQHLCSG